MLLFSRESRRFEFELRTCFQMDGGAFVLAMQPAMPRGESAVDAFLEGIYGCAIRKNRAGEAALRALV